MGTTYKTAWHLLRRIRVAMGGVKKFALAGIEKGATIRSDGYRSYPAALTDFTQEAGIYDPDGRLLNWLHIMVGNAKTFVLGTYHGLSKEYLQS